MGRRDKATDRQTSGIKKKNMGLVCNLSPPPIFSVPQSSPAWLVWLPAQFFPPSLHRT